MVIPGDPKGNPTLIIISGPTAVGKTGVAIEVAKHFGTDIISADSRQFYKQMKIGTAAPSEEQLNAVKHHFIGHLDPHDYFNVSLFEKSVLILLEELFANKSVVIMTGGSGLYIKAVCDGIDDLPDADPEIRKNLINIYNTGGLTSLRRMLQSHDPEYASVVDVANPNRLMRALEVIIQTGKPYSAHLNNEKVKRDFRIIKIALNIPRAKLHERINTRVDEMISAGLVEEARSLYHLKDLNSLNTVGYKELFDYFDGKTGIDEAVEKIKTNTRRYARRQITWFKRDKEFEWMEPDAEAIISWLDSKLK